MINIGEQHGISVDKQHLINSDERCEAKVQEISSLGR
jgi:hypothetical protein